MTRLAEGEEEVLRGLEALLGYSTPPGSTLEERLLLHRQHVEWKAERSREVGRQLATHLAQIAGVLENLNEKTEKRVNEIQSRLSEIADVLVEEKATELGDLVLDVVTKLQFQDIQRQELNGVVEALEVVSGVLGGDEGDGALANLATVLETQVLRTDIDALDVEASGPPIELF